MSDPIWVDTQILIFIIRGDKNLEAELIQIRDHEGHELLITPKTSDELINGNILTQDPMMPQIPSPADANKVRGVLARLKFTVDMEGKKLGDYQKIFTDPKDARKNIDVGQMRRMDYDLRVLQTDRVTESDSLVLSQVKAGAVVRGIKKPVIFTADGGMGMAYNAGTLGIRARKPTPKTPPVPPLPTLPQAKVVNIKNSAKIASAWKATAIGGAIGGALISVAAYFLQKGQNKENEKRIADGFSRLRAEIQRYAATRIRAILDEAVSKAPDGKVYVVAEVEILSSHANTPALTPQAAGMVPPSPEAVNSVKLHAIYISSDKREGAAETKQPFGVIVQETYMYQYVSSDVTPPKDLIIDYNTSRQYLEYNKALLKYPELSAAGRVEIKNIINRLDEQMDQLGTMDKFSPNPNLWTDEGLTRFPD